MPDFSIIACTEVHGTRKEGLSYKGGPTAEVTLECAYADRFLLRTDLINNGYWPYSGGGYVPRCNSAEVTPEPTDYIQEGQAIGYKYAHVRAVYGMDESAGSVSGGGSGAGRQLYTETFEPQLELSTAEFGPPIWLNMSDTPDSGAKKARKHFKEDKPPTIRQYTFAIKRVFYNWVSVPITFATLLGHVNNDVVNFASLGLFFEAETLLFKPRSSQRAVSTTGTAGYTVAVDFIFRAYGWNKWPYVNAAGKFSYKPLWTETQDPATLVVSPVEFKPYPLGDFSDWAF